MDFETACETEEQNPVGRVLIRPHGDLTEQEKTALALIDEFAYVDDDGFINIDGVMGRMSNFRETDSLSEDDVFALVGKHCVAAYFHQADPAALAKARREGISEGSGWDDPRFP